MRPSPDEAGPLFDAILADASFEITMPVANGLIRQGENDRAWERIREARTEIGSVENAEALASCIGTLCALHRSGQANLRKQNVGRTTRGSNGNGPRGSRQAATVGH